MWESVQLKPCSWRSFWSTGVFWQPVLLLCGKMREECCTAKRARHIRIHLGLFWAGQCRTYWYRRLLRSRFRLAHVSCGVLDPSRLVETCLQGWRTGGVKLEVARGELRLARIREKRKACRLYFRKLDWEDLPYYADDPVWNFFFLFDPEKFVETIRSTLWL